MKDNPREINDFFNLLYNKDSDLMYYVNGNGWTIQWFGFDEFCYSRMNPYTKTIILNSNNTKIDSEYLIARSFYFILNHMYLTTMDTIDIAFDITQLNNGDVFAYRWLRTKGREDKIPRNIEKIMRPIYDEAHK